MKPLPPILTLLALCLTTFGESEKIQELLKKAEQGSPEAQHELGVAYLNGPVSFRIKAIKWLTSAGELGHIGAQYLLGDLYQRSYAKVPGLRGNLSASVKWYNSAAEGGDLKAQLALAGIYGRGVRGISKDTLLSEKWQARATKQYLQMAEKGDVDAQYIVGGYYERGRGGLKSDRAKALEWYERSAMQGHKDSMIRCYSLIGSKDHLMSYVWKLTAQYFGKGTASRNYHLNREQQLKAEKLSKELVKKIEASKAEKGNP
jgi:TPR repeat protein